MKSLEIRIKIHIVNYASILLSILWNNKFAFAWTNLTLFSYG